MSMTLLDEAWAQASAPGAGDAEMARYYEVFAAAELFLAIEPETLESDAPQPLLFSLETGETALLFDREDRLADFFGAETAYLSLSGRAALSMFAGGGVQLGVNLGDSPSATILPAEAVSWAVAIIEDEARAEEGGALTLTKPVSADEALLRRIDARLAGMAGIVTEAWLCGDDEGGLVLCLRLSVASAETRVVAALAETSRFAGGDSPAFAIAVVEEGERALLAARRLGLGFTIEAPEHRVEKIPGADPPKLR